MARGAAASHPSNSRGTTRGFRVAERVLLTGHSHQAWPDVAFEAQQQAWLDAAELVDDKWGPAFEVADEVRRGTGGCWTTRTDTSLWGRTRMNC